MNRALSPREMEVLQLTADGLTDGQIARRLGLALPSIKDLQRRVFTKFGAVGRTNAVHLGHQAGLLQ